MLDAAAEYGVPLCDNSLHVFQNGGEANHVALIDVLSFDMKLRVKVLGSSMTSSHVMDHASMGMWFKHHTQLCSSRIPLADRISWGDVYVRRRWVDRFYRSVA